MIPEHARLEACLKALRDSRPPYRPPIRPWRFLEIGQAVISPDMAPAKAAIDWAKRRGWVFSRKKQRDGSGWLVRREA